MRFFPVLFFVITIGCDSQPIVQPAPEKIANSASEPKREIVKKAPDVKIAPAFTTPGNLQNAPSFAESTTTGLYSYQLKKGEEDSTSPNLNSVITVRFSSWTPDGKAFQHSKEKSPFKQRVGNLLKGWQEGIVKMKKGEIRRFWIPGKLAYDHDPNPNSQKGPLIFDIELIDFKNKK